MATSPDVRVRLSAEGVQEVVNALKAIQSQSQKTAASAKQIGAGFSGASAGILSLKSGMSALAGAAAAYVSVDLARTLLNETEQLGRASKQTGIAIEDLSRLAYAAKTVRMDTEALFDALNDFSEKMFDAAAGSGDGADALKAMGFSASYAKENINDLPKIIGDVADKFATYKDGAAKTALAIKLFGDAGKDLVPLLSKGSSGVRELMAASDKLGATISGEAVQSATQFNTQLDKLSTSSKGLAANLAGPLVQALANAMERFNKAREAGMGFMYALNRALIGLGNRTTIAEAQADLDKFAQRYMRTKKLLEENEATGALGAINNWLSNTRANLAAEQADYLRAKENLARLQATEAATATPVDQPTADAPDITIGKDAENAAKAAQARAAAIAAGNERELALLRARNAMTDAEQRAQTEQALLGLEAYHKARLARIEEENANEIQVARDKIAAAKALALPADATEADRISKAAAIAAAEDQLTQVEVQNAERVTEANRAQAAEIKALREERRQLDIQQLEATGRQEEAAIQSLDVQIQKYAELLKKLGETEDAITRLTGEQRTLGMGRVNFEAAQREGTQKLNALDEQKAAVERDQSTGKLWSFQAESQLLYIEKQRIPVLEEMYAKLRAAAEAAQSPELLEQARQMSVAIADAKAKTDTWGQSMAELRQVGFDAAQQGFATFLSDVTSGTKSISGAFQSMAGSVVQALQQVLAKMIAMKAMEAAFSFFGLPVPGGAAVKAATGGYIAGPGTGTSDSIPAWLSNGEFVVRAAAVNAVGLEALHEINRRGRLPAPRVSAAHPGSVQRYADGGLVGSLADATGGGYTQLSIGLDDGLILKKLSSPEGQRVLVEALGQNRRALRQLIG